MRTPRYGPGPMSDESPAAAAGSDRDARSVSGGGIVSDVLLIGDGPEEAAWAEALGRLAGANLAATYPGRGLPAGPQPAADLEAALATAGLEVAIVGGSAELRAEALRRAAAEGLAIIVLHPPAGDADPYYHIALSRAETGAIVVPDLPDRLHQGFAAVLKAIEGSPREVRYERTQADSSLEGTLAAFSRGVDLVRSALGEIVALTATRDELTGRLVVQLKAADGRAGEVRIATGALEPTRLTAVGAGGAATWETDPGGESRVVVRMTGRAPADLPLRGFDPYAAIWATLQAAREGRPARPDLLDGTRAMELTEAVGRSLKRGRTVDLLYEEMSEVGNFKSVMTGLGCGLLLFALVLLPAALAGPALGAPWTVYLAWLIPPVLVVFAVLQLFRFAARGATPARADDGRDPAAGAP